MNKRVPTPAGPPVATPKDLKSRSIPPFCWFLLIVAGIGWGWSVSLTKIAAQSSYHPIALIFWQLIVALIVLGTWMIVSGTKLPFTRAHLIFYCIAGALGTAIPNTLSYYVAPNLPAGIISIVFSLVPMMAFALAVMFRSERFELIRFAGVGLGLASVTMLIGPGFSLGAEFSPFWVILLVFSAFCYACEAIYATFKMPSLDNPLTIVTGMTIASLVMVLPIVIAADIPLGVQQFIGTAELALIGSTLLHIGCYATYLYLIRNTGAIFASQISYVVTLSGVYWGILIFNESHTFWTWAALALAITGLALVRQKNEA